MTNIDFFKSQAKFLQKDFNKNNYSAINRYNDIFFDKENPTLMNFQHVIAKEACFDNWNLLINASDKQLDVSKILFLNQTLNGNGIRFNWESFKGKTKQEIKEFKWLERKELLDNFNSLHRLAVCLSEKIDKTQTVRTKYSSYNIKHHVERSFDYLSFNEYYVFNDFARDNYIPNGALIVSAILANYKWKLCSLNNRDSFSVYFNMSEKSLKQLPGYR